MNLNDLPVLDRVDVQVGSTTFSVRALSVAEMKLIAALYLEPQPPLEERPKVGMIRKVNDPQYCADFTRHSERLVLLEVAMAINYLPAGSASIPSVPALPWDDKGLAEARAWAKATLGELEARLAWPLVQRLHRAMTQAGNIGALIEDERKN